MPLRKTSIARSIVIARAIARKEPRPCARKTFVCSSIISLEPTASLVVAHQSWKTSASRSTSWWPERTMRSNQ
jgi:hypothetical protein